MNPFPSTLQLCLTLCWFVITLHLQGMFSPGKRLQNKNTPPSRSPTEAGQVLIESPCFINNCIEAQLDFIGSVFLTKEAAFAPNFCLCRLHCCWQLKHLLREYEHIVKQVNV